MESATRAFWLDQQDRRLLFLVDVLYDAEDLLDQQRRQPERTARRGA